MYLAIIILDCNFNITRLQDLFFVMFYLKKKIIFLYQLASFRH